MLNTPRGEWGVPWESWEIRTFWGDFGEIRIKTQRQKLPRRRRKSASESQRNTRNTQTGHKIGKTARYEGIVRYQEVSLISEVIQPHEYLISQEI